MTKDVENIIKRLKECVDKSDLSYIELEKRTGIAKSSLQRYISGSTKKIPVDAITAIAKAIGVSPAYLMGWDEKDKLKSPVITEKVVTYPIVGEIAASYDYYAVEDWSGETVDIPESYLKGRMKEDFFVLSVKGDSMYPLYQDGDKVLILKQSTVNQSGDVAAIIYDGEYATLKKVEFVSGEDWLRLVPINPLYQPETIEGSKLEECRVMGIPKLLIREIQI